MRVLYWKAHHDNASAIVSLKVDTFCDFASGDCQKYASSTDITGLSIVFETFLCFSGIFFFDEDVFGVDEIIHESTLFPMFEDMLHIQIGRKEYEYTVWNYLAETSQQLPIGIRNLYVASRSVLRTEILLIECFTQNNGTNWISTDLYVDRFANHRLET